MNLYQQTGGVVHLIEKGGVVRRIVKQNPRFQRGFHQGQAKGLYLGKSPVRNQKEKNHNHFHRKKSRWEKEGESQTKDQGSSFQGQEREVHERRS